jgi:uncharacterized phage-associated protein
MSIIFKFDIDKAIAATVYIASKKPTELTQAKLFKLLYFADRDHLVRYCRPITGDWYTAMKDGPVPSNLYSAFKKMSGAPKIENENARRLARFVRLDTSWQYPRIEAQKQLDSSQLSVSDTQSLDRVLKLYGKMSFTQVRSIAHSTAAYTNAWEKKEETKDASPMSFEDFFEDDANALSGAKEEMIENDCLRKTFEGR